MSITIPRRRLPKDGYMRRATSSVEGHVLAIGATFLSGVCLAQSPTFSLQELSSAGGAGSTVYGINNAGEAVGYIGAGSSICSTLCAVTWLGATPAALAAVQGATDSVASGINNSGQIVGNVTMTQSPHSLNAAVIWNNGTPALLQSPGSQYPQTFANSINDTGEVAGFVELASGTGAPVVWNGLTPTVLGMASGCTGNSAAFGIDHHVDGVALARESYPQGTTLFDHCAGAVSSERAHASCDSPGSRRGNTSPRQSRLS
jgi:hypothetical protein